MVKLNGLASLTDVSRIVPLLDTESFLESLMHKAAYNNTFDAYYGASSGAGAPGTRYRTANPCRQVPQTEIVQTEFPNSLSSFWMTFGGLTLNTAINANVVDGIYSKDYNSADRIAIPTGTIPQWTAVRQEVISPQGLPSYNRVLLSTAALAPPTALLPPIGPGANCAAAPPISQGVLQSFVVNAGGADRWWRLPGVQVGMKYFVHTNYAVLTAIQPVFTNGLNCGVAVAAPSIMLLAGTYVVTISAAGQLWIRLPAVGFGPFPATLCVDVYPYRP